jgi:hypothetical protein
LTFQIGKHHPKEMFDERTKPSDEIIVRTWMDSTLKDITRLVYSFNPIVLFSFYILFFIKMLLGFFIYLFILKLPPFQKKNSKIRTFYSDYLKQHLD